MKLIFIEGVSGAGKSTTTQKLCSKLHSMGYSVNRYREFDFPNPIDFYSTAYFKQDDYDAVLAEHTGFTENIKNNTVIADDIRLVRYYNQITAALSSPEYICLSEAGLTMPTPPPHLRFIKGYLPNGFAEKVCHIHVVYTGDDDSRDKILFRDYLVSHPEAAAEYAELKRKLFKDYEHNRDGYTEAKGAFIKEIIGKARGFA